MPARPAAASSGAGAPIPFPVRAAATSQSERQPETAGWKVAANGGAFAPLEPAAAAAMAPFDRRATAEMPTAMRADRGNVFAVGESTEPFVPEVVFAPQTAVVNETSFAGPGRIVPSADEGEQPDLGFTAGSGPAPWHLNGLPIDDDEDTAAKVSHLEKEMARLLGEIEVKRSST
jgi:hypothetical protein